MRLSLLVVALWVLVFAAAPASSAALSRAARARAIVDAVRAVKTQYGSHAIVWGAWLGRRRLTVGAVGSALPGVPARPDQHFRTGNTAEWFMGTLLLRMVDRHEIRLDDPISRWYPDLPDADEVTVGMLASSISGYNDFVTTDAFVDAYAADPFRQWRADELIAIAMSKPALFPPGTSWAFSDTNFVLLGQILERVARKPLGDLYRENLFAPLGMRQTRANPNAEVPAPALHGYETERGVYEDATNWSPSWVPGVANVTSTVADLGRWVRSYRSLLSARSGRQQTAPDQVGKGPLTDRNYYAIGIGVTGGWIASNPQLMGYNGIAAYLPSKRLSFVVYTTLGRTTDPDLAPATAVFLDVAQKLAPGNIPGFSVLVRGEGGSPP
jgi:D-alanyl-D-alanine carboxypeptidase